MQSSSTRRARTQALGIVGVVIAALLFSTAGTGSAAAVTPVDGVGAPTISSDQADYAPGSQVVLRGGGWQPGEAVHLDVNDDLGRTWEHTADVVADDSGAITDTFTLPDWFVATYRVDATGAASGTVTTTFTDGNIKVDARDTTGATVSASQSAVVSSGNNCTGTVTDSAALKSNGSITAGPGDWALVTTSSTTTGGQPFLRWTVDGTTTPGTSTDPRKICVAGPSGSTNLVAVYQSSAATTTALTSSAAPSVYGDALTLTATVSGSGGSPSGGTVAFRDAGAAISGCGAVPLSAGSRATCSLPALAASTLAVGTHSLTAVYSGSGSFPGSTGSLSQVVNKRTLTGSFTALDKLYDGTTAAQISARSLTGGIVGNDVVSLTGGTATFDSAGAGTNKTVTGTGFALTGANTGSYQLASPTLSTTASIGTHALTVAFTADDKVYDGTTDATITGRTLTGLLPGDTVSISGGTARFDTKDTGAQKTVSASGFTLGGADASNYAVTTIRTTTASIAAKPLTGTFTVLDKIYDGTRDATFASRALNGVVGSDDVSLSVGSAQFATRNAGTGITVTGTGFGLLGAAASNYTLTSVADATARIAPLHVTGTFTAFDKVYDGTRASSVSTTSVKGQIPGDDVTLQGSAQFADSHVGSAKTVSFEDAALAGGDAGNYLLDGVPVTTAGITARTVTGGFTVADKPYDGTVSATITGRELSGVIGSDDVSLTGGAASFASARVGHGITVTGTEFALGGASKGDYALASTSLTTTADITPLAVMGHLTVEDKTYDGTTAATILTRSVSGALSGDEVTLTGGTAAFDDKLVGTGKSVTLLGATLAGADAANYALQDPAPTTRADIDAKHITGSFTAEDKTYDGTTAATVHTRSLSGTITGDQVTLTGGTATFGTKNAGTAKTVTLTGATLTGDDAANYTLDSVGTTTAEINARQVTVEFSAADKVYDGTTDATIMGATLSGEVIGDDVDVDSTGASSSFADKVVGTGKRVTGHGFELVGDDAGNYLIHTVLPTAADITAKHVTGSFTAEDKTYDGTTAATVHTRSLSGTITGDQVTLTGGTATFGTKNAGPAKTVTLTGATLTGDDAANYTLDSVATTTADIKPQHITGSFTAEDKTYDGTTAATVHTRSLSGTITGDQVTLTGGTATFGTKNAGPAKTVTLTDATLTGDDAANYTLDSVATTTADINALPITGSFTARGKTYDGLVTATVAGRDLAGVLGGDAVWLTGGTATFSDKNVGTGKTVTLTGAGLAGLDAANYRLTSVSTTTASITKQTLTVTADDKTMTMGAALPTLTGQVAGQVAGDTIVTTYSTTATSSSTGGFYPITPNVSDTPPGVLGNYDVRVVNGTLNVTFVWNGYLQPVNDTAHQIGVAESKFKLGQTIPLKFDLATATGASVQQAGNPLFSVGNYRATCDSDAAADTVPTVTADPSAVYTYTGGHYQFNWSTKAVTKAGEYRVYAALADGTKPWVDVCLR